ncbi:MAG: PLP-dependent transferase [Bacteroidetes bacterium]|nr:PLP-dependent transferase [Bacteroidota bacterium]
MIDLRSDTVTKPSEAMRFAMANASVGDDVFSEDPTVQLLEAEAAAIVGKEAALYCPTGCMTNQLALKVHTTEGDEVIVEEDSHIYNYETTAASFLSRIQLHPVKAQDKGILSAGEVASAVRDKAYYMPVTRLIALENTHNRAGGTIYPMERIAEISHVAREKGIGMHLDGARLWNACAAIGHEPIEYAAHFDTVSICFSKGLGAPVGSAICGTREHIEKARRFRKMWGGGMRQVGIIAAGALFALRNNRTRVAEDNAHARSFAEYIAKHATSVHIDLDSVQSNIVLMQPLDVSVSMDDHIAELEKRGVRLSHGKPGTLRAVTHLDVSSIDCASAAQVIAEYFS